MTAPNAELAYRVLDHIDAHPEEWDRSTTQHVVREECGGVRDDDGRLVSARVMAERLLGVPSRLHEGEGDEEDLFDQYNTREDLGRLVAEIFGPRPVAAQ